MIAGVDTPVQINGQRVPRGYTVWIAGQDDAGHWYPLGQAYWDQGLGAYTTTIRSAQVPDPEAMTVHPVIANSGGQEGLREYQLRGDKTVGLDELPKGSVAADQ